MESKEPDKKPGADAAAAAAAAAKKKKKKPNKGGKGGDKEEQELVRLNLFYFPSLKTSLFLCSLLSSPLDY